MSLSSQLGTFIAVGAGYVSFTFLWAWYKAKQEDERKDEPERSLGGGS